MSPDTAAMIAGVAAVAVLALAMVYAMVQWSIGLLQARLPAEGEPLLHRGLGGATTRRWGIIYGLLWIALIGAFYLLLGTLGDERPGRRLALLLGIATSWIGCNLVFVWYGRALRRVGERTAASTQDAGQPSHAEADRRSSPPELAVRRESRRSRAPAARPQEAVGRHLPGSLVQALWIAGFLVIAALAQSLPPLRRLDDFFRAHQRVFLISLGAAAGVGLILFIGNAVAMVLARGVAMSREEIEELERRMMLLKAGSPMALRWAAVRVPEAAVGAEVEETATFSEIKAAFRARAWQVSPYWRRFFSLMIGALLLAIGLFGIAVVLGPPAVKLLFAGAMLYAAIRLLWAFARA
jgi:hypothetical protein